ncbi:MAG: hypothetical protein RRA94_06335 [Bacteroidota bacterium]|nr:hypothetical protein [Bacteroidota bacterium]
MKYLITCCILFAIGFAGCVEDPAAPTPPTGGDDEYAVYSALIDSLYIFDETEVVVIRDMTEPYDLSDDNSRSFVRDQLQVSDALIDAYVARNGPSVALRRALTIDLDYRLIADSTFQHILTTGGYEEFYRRYPGAQGHLTLSRVGFSADGNTALVYASNTPAFLAGMGICTTLMKHGDQWRVTGHVIVWIS